METNKKSNPLYLKSFSLYAWLFLSVTVCLNAQTNSNPNKLLIGATLNYNELNTIKETLLPASDYRYPFLG